MMIFQTVGIQIFSFLYLLLIFIVYYSKKRFNSLENSIFRILLVFTTIMLLIDIIMNYTIRFSDIVPISNFILCKFTFLGYQIWSALLMLYVFLLGNNGKYNNIKDLYIKSNKMKIGTFIVSILGLISIFLPFTSVYDPKYNIAYLSGNSTLYVYGVTILYLLIILLTVIINKNRVSLTKRLPIFIFFICACIFLPIQRFSVDVPVLIVPLMAYAVMIMYFTLENPDLKLINELNKLKMEAEEANKVKSNFLSNISEDIKKPMNAIIGFSETILVEDINDKVRNDVNAINISGKQLYKMLNNAVDITNAEYDELKILNNSYSLRRMLDKLSLYAYKNIDKSNVKFNINIKEDMPYKLYGDEVKIYTILNNLLSNAIKYTEVGKISLIINSIVENDNLNINIKIIDTGIGIKEEDYEKIFEKFSRIDNNKLGKNGTGLGLAITKKMVELLKGTITFKSTFGGGTTFEINLTQKIESLEPIGIYTPKVEEEKIEFINCSDKDIVLYAEDEDIIKVLNRMLSYYDIKLNVEKDMDKALNILKSNKKYDLILIDLDTYNKENVEIIKSITQNTKVIGIKSNTYEFPIEHYKKEIIDYILNKPLTLQNINYVIKNFLKK